MSDHGPQCATWELACDDCIARFQAWKASTPTTDRDELVERLSGPHEWGYRCIADGTFIADDAPFQAAERIQADAATIAGMRAALVEARDTFARYAHLHQMKGTNEGMAKAVANNELALKMAAALKGGDHG